MSGRPRPRLSTSPFRVPSWAINSIAALVSTIVCLTGVELLVRVLEKRAPTKWTDRPSNFFMASDAPNMSDQLYDKRKPENTFRISVVGDSFTFGPRMQVEDTFPKRLEHWLNLNGQNPRVEVINRGVSGTATHDQVPLVARELLGNPDTVVLEITLNDAEDHPLTPEEKEQQFGVHRIETPILRNIHLLQFIMSRLNNVESRRSYVSYHSSGFENPKSYNRFRGSLESMLEQSKKANVALVAVIFPMFDFPFDNRYPFQKTHEIIGSTLKDLGIPHLDLLSAYDGIPNDHLVVLPGVDSHPNEIAHRIAAERLLLFLRRNKLLPEGSFPIRRYKQRENLVEKHIRRRPKHSAVQGAPEITEPESEDDDATETE